MYTIIGMTLAILLAMGTIRAGAWLRANRGLDWAPRKAQLVGIGVGAVLFLGLLYIPGLPNEVGSGIAIGIGVGIGQGWSKPR